MIPPKKATRTLRASGPKPSKESGDSNQAAAFQQPLSFPVRSFGSSFLAWVRSDSFPLEGPTAARLLDQLKTIEEACELVRDRYREVLGKEPNAIPGWQLVPGAHVRELGQHSAADVWSAFQAEDYPLSLEDFLACCRPGLTALEKAIADTEFVEPTQARTLLNQLLGELLTYRQNQPSLRRLPALQAQAQRQRLEERDEE